MARRRAVERPAPVIPSGVPNDLAAGPCVEVWAAPGEPAMFSARRRWRAARDAWCRTHGLMNGSRPDWPRLPRELRDRAPYYRKDRA